MLLTHPAPIDSAPLQLRDLPVPEPAAGEIRVRVAACGICRTDLHVVEGELPPQLDAVVPGHQVVGIVDRCGAGRDALQEGDRVGIAWLRVDLRHVPLLPCRQREPLPTGALHRLSRQRRLRRVCGGARRFRLRRAGGVRRCGGDAAAVRGDHRLPGAAPRRHAAGRAGWASTASARRRTSPSRWRATSAARCT